MLLGRGAAVNDPNNRGVAPLHMASREGHLEVVRLLLEHGADLNAYNKAGQTPSDVASLYGKQEIVQLLSEYNTKSVTG
jgi:ankyrin repeat protein